MVRLTLITLLLAALPVALTDRRCGFTPTPAFVADSVAAAVQDKIDIAALAPPTKRGMNLTKRWTWPKPTKWLFVPVYFHVVARGTTLREGWIPDSWIWEQYKVINEDYAPVKVKFIPFGIDRTINPVWATDANGTGTSTLEMMTALRRGNYKTLNIYIMNYLENNWAGFADNPDTVTDESTRFNRDGLRILYTTLPGGGEQYLDLGKLTTHEIGHWLGLLHTFEGESCTGAGDLVADTPQESVASFLCPAGFVKDSCPDSPGVDPLHNYMDYGEDACMTEFTPLQIKRMHTMYHKYRNPTNDWKWW